MNDANYFSANYLEARERFRKAAVGFGSLSQFIVPSARDPDLTVDYLFRPATRQKETLLVLTSGVHGSEGFAGSAVQNMFLTEIIEKLSTESTGLLLVHALNPFGFKYDRRSTEANVNLNRNFGSDETLFQTANTEYDRLAPLLKPRSPAGSPGAAFFAALKFVAGAIFLKGFTGESLNRAIAHGQFKHPDGLEYGGETWEPQIEDFIARLRECAKPYKNLVIFDLHTGLGDRYELHLIPVDEPKSRDEYLLRWLFRPDEETSLYKVTDPLQPGFYETAGDLNSLPPRIAPAGQRTLTLTFEYGTLGNSTFCKISSLARLLNENRGYFKGYRSEADRAESRAAFLEMFNPADDPWRANVVARARSVLNNVIDRLNRPA